MKVGASYRKGSSAPQPIRLQQLKNLQGSSGCINYFIVKRRAMDREWRLKVFEWQNFIIEWAQRILLESNAIFPSWDLLARPTQQNVDLT